MNGSRPWVLTEYSGHEPFTVQPQKWETGRKTIKKNKFYVLTYCVHAQDKWHLTHDDVDIMDELGEGNFGTVYRGFMKSTNDYVAVKTCKDNVDKITRSKFLDEAR